MAPRKKNSSTEMVELHEQVENFKHRLISDLKTPRWSTKFLVAKRGIPRLTLNNWHTREEFKGEFALDADAVRDGNEARLFSSRDVLLISGLKDLSEVGAPLPIAKMAAKLMVDAVLAMPIVNSSMGRPQIIVFKRNGEWWVVPVAGALSKTTDLQERQVRAHVYSKDCAWREEKISDRLTDAPPAQMVFDIIEFSRRVFADLGMSVVFGSASDLRHAAEREGA